MATEPVTIRAEGRSEASPEELWAVLADGAGWSRWTRMRRSSLEREGDPPPDGVGAVRRFETWPFVSREEVELWEPPRRLGYTLLSGLPVDDYHAVVELRPDGEGTVITWTSTFRTRPGRGLLMRALIRASLSDFTKRLANTRS